MSDCLCKNCCGKCLNEEVERELGPLIEEDDEGLGLGVIGGSSTC